jgi:hypothetical protein
MHLEDPNPDRVGAAGAMVDLSPEMCRGLPKTPCMFNSSELLFAIVHRMVGWDLRQPLNPAKKHFNHDLS